MSKLSTSLVAVSVAAVLGSAQFAFAQSGATEEQHTQPTSAEKYVPGLGDFMSAYVQSHHIRLWEAGKNHNWVLATYEAHELKETFDDVITYQGKWHDKPVDDMVRSMMFKPIEDVSKAVKSHSEAKFKRAYNELTTACTACHAALDHKFIVIKAPTGPTFGADQKY